MGVKVLGSARSSAIVALLLALVACAGGGEGDTDGGDGAGGKEVVLAPDAPPLPGESACEVVIRTGIPVAGQNHVPNCTPVAYTTNPPSSGNHWGVWAAYKTYTEPVPREMYVHDLEHGAIVLAYRCEADCPEVTALLQEVADGVPEDPKCTQIPGGPRARLVLTPDPALDTPVAAATWGATYTATCLDRASLAEFVADNYARGPEDTCSPGMDIADPLIQDTLQCD